MILLGTTSPALRRRIETQAGDAGRPLTTTDTPDGVEVGPDPLSESEQRRIVGLVAADAEEPFTT
jgi:hypothetical protein